MGNHQLFLILKKFKLLQLLWILAKLENVLLNNDANSKPLQISKIKFIVPSNLLGFSYDYFEG